MRLSVNVALLIFLFATNGDCRRCHRCSCDSETHKCPCLKESSVSVPTTHIPTTTIEITTTSSSASPITTNCAFLLIFS